MALLRRDRKCDLVGADVQLKVGFEVLNAHAAPS